MFKRAQPHANDPATGHWVWMGWGQVNRQGSFYPMNKERIGSFPVFLRFLPADNTTTGLPGILQNQGRVDINPAHSLQVE